MFSTRIHISSFVTWLPSVLAFIQPFMDDPCHWDYKIVDSFDLTYLFTLPQNPSDKNLTTVLKNIGIDFLNNRTPERFTGYPTFLQLQLTCPDQDAETLAGITGASGAVPRVTLRLTSYDEASLRPTKRIMMDLEGVLVYVSDTAQLQGEDYEFLKNNWTYVKPTDTSQYSKTPGIKATLPKYAWIVPLPIRSNTCGVDVAVASPSTKVTSKFSLKWDNYAGLTKSGPLVPSPVYMTDIPDAVFAGFPMGVANGLTGLQLPSVLAYGNVLMYSADNWSTAQSYSFSVPTSPVLCANGQTAFQILSHAVMHNRILIATNYGVLQFLGGVSGTSSMVLNKCAVSIHLPGLNNLTGASVTFLTDTGDLYWTPYFSWNITKTVSSSDLQSVPAGVLPGGTLQVVDVIAAGLLEISLLVNISVPAVPSKFCWVGVSFSGTDRFVGVKSCMPQYIPENTSGALPMNIVADTAISNASFSATRVLQSEFNSKEIYAFGNAVFYSSDAGSSWTYLPSFPFGRTVKTTQVIRSGGRRILLQALNDAGEQEVWTTTWGQAEVYKVFPSYAWDMSLQLGSTPSSIRTDWQKAASRKLLTVYPDSNGKLRQLFAVKQSFWSLSSIPLECEQIVASMSSSVLSAASSFQNSGSFQPSDCLEIQVSVKRRSSLDRLEYFQFRRPRTKPATFYDHPEVATAYSAIVHALFNYSLKSMDNNYTSSEAGFLEHVSGYFEEGPFATQSDFENIMARAEARRIVVMGGDYKNRPLSDDDPLLAEFPQDVYVDRGDYVVIKASIYDFVPQGDGSDVPQISFRMANGTLLSGTTEVTYDAENQTAYYTLTFVETGTLTPAPPGTQLAKESLSILLPQPLQCYPNRAAYDTTVHIGCLPATELQYNWELVLQASTSNTTFFDCTDPVENMPCIDHSGSVNMHLELVDHASNQALNFTGRYRMFVIGFGMGSPNNIARFAESELPTYNTDFPDGSNAKNMIWSPMNDVPLYANDTRVLDHFHNAIKFVCASDSPCGNPSIKVSEEPHLNFLVRVTNKGLPDVDTYCLFELEFVIRIRGADPNPYAVSIPVLLVTLTILFILCGFYVLVFFWRLRVDAAYAAYKQRTAGENASGVSAYSVHSKIK